jgi:hypothetical protein
MENSKGRSSKWKDVDSIDLTGAEEEDEVEIIDVEGEDTSSTWACSQCTYNNHKSCAACEVCGNANTSARSSITRPYSSFVPASHIFPAHPHVMGDWTRGSSSEQWICPACTFSNHGVMQMCEACHTARHPFGHSLPAPPINSARHPFGHSLPAPPIHYPPLNLQPVVPAPPKVTSKTVKRKRKEDVRLGREGASSSADAISRSKEKKSKGRGSKAERNNMDLDRIPESSGGGGKRNKGRSAPRAMVPTPNYDFDDFEGFPRHLMGPGYYPGFQDFLMRQQYPGFMNPGGMGMMGNNGGWEVDVDNMDYDELCERFAAPKKTATSSTIRSFPTKNLTKEDVDKLPEEKTECPVCLDAFKAADKAKTLPCLHQFHAGSNSFACAFLCNFFIVFAFYLKRSMY